jgi:flavin reductase (DIM6/NTAB) family NADH-FMN oxidoreductase RutF
MDENVFRLIANDWFLLTAGDMPSGYNTMTASWGGLGQLWHRRVSFVFVRPQRYTWNFTERNTLYTMTFFEEKHREVLKFCGTHSGKDCNKAAETGLTPFEPYPGTTAFKEAKLILVCRKLYFQDIDPSRFLDTEIDTLYPQKGYHRMYVGEIKKVLTTT